MIEKRIYAEVNHKFDQPQIGWLKNIYRKPVSQSFDRPILTTEKHVDLQATAMLKEHSQKFKQQEWDLWAIQWQVSKWWAISKNAGVLKWGYSQIIRNSTI